jgi:hypothetical protein
MRALTSFQHLLRIMAARMHTGAGGAASASAALAAMRADGQPGAGDILADIDMASVEAEAGNFSDGEAAAAAASGVDCEALLDQQAGPLPGVLIACAYPERVAQRQSRGNR